MPAPTLVESSQRSQHGTWIEIRLDRLNQNLNRLKERSGSRCEALAVVKANAYGHGLLEIAKSLAGKVAYLGISSVHEALELKGHRIETPLFLFGRIFGSELPAVLTEGITLSISSLEESEEISALSQSLGRKTLAHIKIDTGMGRLGIPFRDAIRNIEKITALPGIIPEGIYTHFPTAEREDGFRDKQFQDFALLLQSLESKGITFRFRHASNSAGTLKIKSPVLNLIRPGLMLYGIYPDPTLAEIATVAPILSLKSRIVLVKRLKPGESVGYGRDFITDKPVNIATLPIGYSHGYPFNASNRAWILYRGKRYPIAGRVSMDYIAVNLGDTPAKAGDEVTLIGEDSGEKISAEELARWSGTIPYEIVTRLISRIPRFYRP